MGRKWVNLEFDELPVFVEEKEINFLLSKQSVSDLLYLIKIIIYIIYIYIYIYQLTNSSSSVEESVVSSNGSYNYS